MGKNIVRRKKAKLVRYKVCDDCRECRRKMFEENPLVKEVGSIADFKESTFHLYRTKNSLEYLLRMTATCSVEMPRLFSETGNRELSDLVGEYFGDVEQVLRMVIGMKRVTEGQKDVEL